MELVASVMQPPAESTSARSGVWWRWEDVEGDSDLGTAPQEKLSVTDKVVVCFQLAEICQYLGVGGLGRVPSCPGVTMYLVQPSLTFILDVHTVDWYMIVYHVHIYRPQRRSRKTYPTSFSLYPAQL